MSINTDEVRIIGSVVRDIGIGTLKGQDIVLGGVCPVGDIMLVDS